MCLYGQPWGLEEYLGSPTLGSEQLMFLMFSLSKQGEGSFLTVRRVKCTQNMPWERSSVEAGLKQEKRILVGKGENNVHSQEADKNAQCHGMSGFLSQHFTQHTGAEPG